MSDHTNGSPEDLHGAELKLPAFGDEIKEQHSKIEKEWDSLRQSACQTAAGRALWKHAVHDPLAEVLAGEAHLRSFHEKMRKDHKNNAREISGVILAVRTLWFDSKLEAAVNSICGGAAQVVLLGAGMDARSYRLAFLSRSDVFEVDFPDVLQVKHALIKAAIDSTYGYHQVKITSNSLPHSNAIQILKTIAEKCSCTNTVLLADFMNQPTTTLSSSTYQFYSDWPEQLLPTLGFTDVKLSQIGDTDANFGLTHDPLNLFNKLRSLPRSVKIHPEDGTPCRRLYLVQASGLPNRTQSQ